MGIKKKIAVTGASAAVSLSVLLSMLFSSPADMLPSSKNPAQLPTAEIAVSVAESEDCLAFGSGDAAEDEKKSRRGLFARLRSLFLQAPVAVRALVGVPLWALGWLITSAVSLLWANVLSPAMGTIVSWLLFAGLLLLAFIFACRVMFPDIPVKKILSRRNILTLILGAAVLCASNFVVPLFWDGWDDVSVYVRLGGSLLLILWLLGSTAVSVARGKATGQ